MALLPTPRVTTTVVYPAGNEPVTVSSTRWHRPTIFPFGVPASLSFRDARHASNDAYVVGEASMGVQTVASPGLQESKSITAAVAGSILEAPLRRASTRIDGLCCTGSPGDGPLPHGGRALPTLVTRNLLILAINDILTAVIQPSTKHGGWGKHLLVDVPTRAPRSRRTVDQCGAHA